MNIKKLQWILSGASYSPQYQAVLTYATAQGYTLPSTWDKYNEDLAVRNMVSSGLFAKADIIYNFSTTGDRNFAAINIANPGTYNATIDAAFNFVPGRGFWPTGGSNKYIRTNYIPLTNGVNFKQNDGGVICCVDEDGAGNSSAVELGSGDGSLVNAVAITLRSAGNAVLVRFNEATNVTVGSGMTSAKHRYYFSRSASNSLKTFLDGSQFGSTSNQASTGLSGSEFYIDGYNANGTPSFFGSRFVSFFYIGANLDSIVATVDANYQSYRSNNLAITIPSFPDKTSISNYLTSIGGLSAGGIGSQLPSTAKISTLTGSSSMFGGALASNGKIYCAPGIGTTAYALDTSDQSVAAFGTFAAGANKYGGAVFANGSIYFIPATSTVVAKVNISTNGVTWFDSSGVKGTESGNLGATTQKWYGGYIGADGRIYCIPYNQTAIMIIDPTTDGITFMDTSGVVAGPTGNLSGTGKWDTGFCYGANIYGTPSDATDILKIVTSGTPSCSRVSSFVAGSAKWCFSIIAPNGYVYMFPYYRNDILKYDPNSDTYTTVSGQTIGTNNDSKIKCLGANIMADGNILVTTVDATLTNNYIFNTTTETLTSFPRIDTAVTSNGLVLASDGSCYGVPGTGNNFIVYYYPHRGITLPNNFTDSNMVKGY